MQLSDLIALASIMRSPGGPQIQQLAKAPNNVTGLPMSRAALNNPPMSDPAQMLAAMTRAAGVPSEIALHGAQADQARALADSFRISGEPAPPMFGGGVGPQVALTPQGGASPAPMALSPAGAADSLVPGGKLDFQALRSFAQKAGFQGPAADTMAATALAESSGDPNAIGDRDIGGSFGVTQINQKAHGPVAQEALGNPLRAMQLAFDVSKGGSDFSPWTMFKNGGYQKYLPTSGSDSGQGAFGSLAPGAPFGGGIASSIDPSYLAWAQRQDANNSRIGRRNPIAVEEALKLQFAPLQKNLDLQFAGPTEAAKRGAGLPFVGPETSAKSGAEFPYQSALKTQEANSQLRNQLAGLGLQLNAQGGVEQIPGFAGNTAALAGAKSAGERGITEPSDIRIGQAKEGNTQVPLPGGGYRLEPIAGSTAETARRAQESTKSATTDVVMRNVDRAFDLSGAWTTGALGSFLQGVPGTPAHDMATTLGTIEANSSFTALQEMRNASPTGGALGPVSDYENRALRSAYSNLAQSQTRSQFETNLSEFRKTFLDVVYGTPDRLAEKLKGGNITKREYDLAMEKRNVVPQASGGPQKLIFDPATGTLKPAP